MKCDDCVFAEWKRTSNGRLHPSKQGMCKVKKDVPIPRSMRHELCFYTEKKVIEIRGSYIKRGDVFAECAYFGRGEV